MLWTTYKRSISIFFLEEEFSVDLNFLQRFIKTAGQHSAPLQ